MAVVVLAVARRQTSDTDCTMRAITRMLLLSVCGWCAGEPLASALARRRDAAHAHASTFAREHEPYVYAAVPLHAPVPVLHVLSPAPLSAPSPHALKPRPYAYSIRHTAFTRPYTESRPYESNAYTESRPYVESRPYPESRPYAQSRPYGEVRPYVESRPFGSSRPYVDAVEYVESAGSEYGHAAHLKLGRPSLSEPVRAEFDSYVQQAYPPAPVRAKLAQRAPSLEAEAPYSSQEPAPTVLYARPSLAGGYTYRPVANTKSPYKKAPSLNEQPVVVKIHKHKIMKS